MTGTGGLLELALSRPNEAMARARAMLAAAPGPLAASVAHQAVGLVLREYGDIDAAIAELRIARRLAAQADSADREADVLGTLGVALIFAGRTTAGRNALNQAVHRVTGTARGRPLLRRGAVLRLLGDHRAALDDLNNAIPVLRAAGDQLWEARALSYRALCLLVTGSVQHAADDQRRSEELFASCGQELELAEAVMSRGVVALRTGHLPDALACFDAADNQFAALGVQEEEVSEHRCATLLAAGLAADALREADSAISRLAQIRGQPTRRAELLLVAANCALAAGDPGAALTRAAEAVRVFGRQDRRWWQAHARLAQVRAAAAAGPVTAALVRDARRCVRELAGLGSAELPLARLAAGRIAADLATDERAAGAAARPGGAGRLLAEADGYLAAAAAGRRHGPALSRAAGWLAQARRAELAGDSRRLMQACRRGLAVIDGFRSVLGSSELRAQSTAHGAELAALGLRHAARLGRPRLMLNWSERWRAVAFAVPAVQPPADMTLQAGLAALRDISSRLSRAAAAGQPTGALEQERQRLERAVRGRALHASAGNGAGTQDQRLPFDARVLLGALGDRRLVELVDVDGELHALVCGGGRVRRFTVGPVEQAVRGLRFARLALRRVARGPAVSPDDRVVHAWLAAAGEDLDRALLGEAGDHLGAGSVIVVPPGRLHAVPWGLLPRLRSRTVTVAPSAATWLRIRQTPAGIPHAARPAGHVALIRGPGLASRGAEVDGLAASYTAQSAAAGGPRPVVLGDGTATVANVLHAIDGAALAHIAAHGTFRADSPLFSALRLDDGPLTAYDLERLRRGPRLLVLSSCDSAVAAPAGADEVLGLASALFPLGTAAIVASVVPVNDAAAVPLMLALHQCLRTGASPAEALRDARGGAAADPVTAATAWSFICLGG